MGEGILSLGETVSLALLTCLPQRGRGAGSGVEASVLPPTRRGSRCLEILSPRTPGTGTQARDRLLGFGGSPPVADAPPDPSSPPLAAPPPPTHCPPA